ncbi:MAG: valine--tRNA ligase [Bacteroidia bacterium]|nr:valine--tRNA ligase [Bacteroidia bacterium]MDW8158359.1 valine--tRNA ligase [Bacteroidia bacterium]
MKEAPKSYDFQTVEKKWYQYWVEKGFFNADPDPTRKPYTIVIPPPNVTGVLHMGHMLNNTIQDVLIRRKRMEGYNACWVPGTDHASIATEAKVVAMLAEKGIYKKDLSRAEFLKYAWEWKEKYGGIILEQLKKLGASCDWRRTRFTMEEKLSRAVIKVFVDLYNKGLIYRGIRMVNWDPQGKTALSDEEVIYKEVSGKLYYVRYPIENTKNEYITIATTRPETILADTGVAFHPQDQRYQHLIGKNAILPLISRKVPIITDSAIDPTYGTGCLKVTPAHDIVDYEIGLRHNLPVIDILNEDGTLNENAQILIGEDRFVAREKVVQLLEKEGYLLKTEDIIHKVGFSERTDAIIEPRLSMQWFLKMERLAKPALKAVLEPENEGIKLIPSRFINTYKHWMENVHDWCISRQLWWGHQIPAYFFGEDGKFVVAETREEAWRLAKEQGFTGKAEELCQDADVLDTWFSSWLWPISVFDGFENPNNPDFLYFYPTNDLVTAPEILFFWVARMIMAGYEYTGKRPFQNVYLHGIVRDKQRRKMSKSLGNSPDPIELIEKYSADGVRIGMLLAAPAGNDLLFDESLCDQGKNFIHKIWNAFRLVDSWKNNATNQLLNTTESLAIDWINAKIHAAAQELIHLFENFRIADALMLVYKLTWDDFCSWYLEMIKPAVGQKVSEKAYENTVKIFEYLLQLLHPFIPFITEEIWHLLKEREAHECLIVQKLFEPTVVNNAILEEMELVHESITALRALRIEKNIPTKQSTDLYIKTQRTALFQKYEPLFRKFIAIEKFEFTDSQPQGSASVLVKNHEFFVPLACIDLEAEKRKLQQEIEYTEGFLEIVNKKLNNSKFLENAKPEVVEREKQKQKDAQAKLAALKEILQGLEK